MQPGVSPAPGQLPPGVSTDHAEVGEYIFDRLRDCDVDPTAPPHDCLHDFAFEVVVVVVTVGVVRLPSEARQIDFRRQR